MNTIFGKQRIGFITAVVLGSIIFSIIPIGAIAATSGPVSGSTIADATNGNASAAWSNPSNAGASDDTYATTSITTNGNGATTHFLKATGFNLNIPPNATILGIQVNVERSASGTAGNTISDDKVSLINNGTVSNSSSNDKSTNTSWPTTDGIATYGSASDLWGQTWTPTTINSATTGIEISAKHLSGTATTVAKIDNITMTVTYTTQSTVTGITSSPTNASYKVGGSVPISVSFSNPVTVTGAPTLALNDGATASYTSGSGTNTLLFTYTVAAAQNTTSLDVASSTSLVLNGGTIQDGSAQAALLTLPTGTNTASLATHTTIVIDTTAPVITQITAVPSSTTDNTPSYTFHTSESGTITYGGDCSASDTSASGSGSGNNTKTFTTLAVGTHSNCTILVTDTAGNQSNLLPIPSFTILATPDLTVVKTNDAGGTVTIGNSFNWILTISNANAPATFANGNTILTDSLPTNANYTTSTMTVVLGGGSTGTVVCNVAGTSSKTLTCTASGTVTLPAGGTITVSLPTTPTATGNLANPRNGGTCEVNPSVNGNRAVTESTTSNDTCSNTVSVTAIPISITPTILNDGTVGTFYSQVFNATTNASGTLAWTSIGTLPAGLNFSSSTATLSGTPTAPGTTIFQIRAATGSSSSTLALSLLVHPSVATSSLVNVVVSATGGTAQSSDFLVTVNGGTPSSFPGSTSGTAVTVVPNVSYAITASSLPNYTQILNAGCSGTLNAGASSTCNIANTFAPPTVTVTVTSDGGPNAASNFTETLIANGSAITPSSSFAGNTAGTTLTVTMPSLSAQAYAVQETPVANYAPTYSAGCSGNSLVAGSAVNCTVSNHYTAPPTTGTLNVAVNVDNTAGGSAVAGNFNVTVTGASPSPSSFGGTAVATPVSVAGGVNFSVAVSPLANYNATSTGNCSGSVSIGNSDSCTFTETYVAPTTPTSTLSVNIVTNGGSATTANFNLKITDGTSTVSNGTAAANQQFTLNQGDSYSVTEATTTPSANYGIALGAGCSGTVGASPITCSITNTFVPPSATTSTLTVFVTTAGDGKLPSDVTVNVTNGTSSIPSFAGSASGTPVTLNPGTFSVVGSALTNYTATSTGTCSGTVSAGQTPSCTLAYTFVPPAATTSTLKVVVSVVNTGGGSAIASSFGITMSGASSTPGSFNGNASGTNVIVNGGATFTVNAASVTNYNTNTSGNCTGPITAGQTATCTISETFVNPNPTGNLILNPLLASTQSSGVAPNPAIIPTNWQANDYGDADNAGTSFAFPASGWTGTGNGARVTISSYGTTGSGDAKWVFDRVAVTPGAEYTYTDNYTSNAQSYIFAAFQGNPLLATLPSSGNALATTTVVFDAPANATSVTIYHVISSNGTLTTGNFSLVQTGSAGANAFPTGIVSLTFDDGWQSDYDNALPILTGSSIPSSFYIITNTMGAGGQGLFSNFQPENQTGVSTNCDGTPGDFCAASSTLGATWSNIYTDPNSHSFSFTDTYASTATTTVKVTYTPSVGAQTTITVATIPSSGGVAKSFTNNFTLPALASSSPISVSHQSTTGVTTITTNSLNQNSAVNSAGYMTTPEVLGLQSAGEEVGAHTLDHCNLQMLDADPGSATTGGTQGPPAGACATALNASSTAQQQIDGSRLALITAGATPVDTLAYPYGGTDANVEALLKQDGIIGARTSNTGFNYLNTDPYSLYTQVIDASTTFDPNGLAQAESWIDAAASGKAWVVILLHQVESTSTINTNNDIDATTPQFLQQLVTYIKNKNGITAMTMHQVLSQYYGLVSSPSAPVTPVATPGAGNYAIPQTVSLFSANATALRYTTNGTAPSCASGSVYNNTPITIGSSTDLKAIGCNSAGQSSVMDAVYTITSAPTISIVPTSIPTSTIGVAFSQLITASTTIATGSFNWSILSGTLPAGLLLNTSSTNATTTISGTPTANGSSTFTIKVVNGAVSSTQQYTMTITSAPVITITATSTMPAGAINVPYSQFITATSTNASDTLTWSIATGTLPLGLNLTTSTGKISGTPTATSTNAFTIMVSGKNPASATSSKAFTLTIASAPAITITPTSLATGTIGVAYSQLFAATSTNVTGPFTWSATGTLPTGITFKPASSTLSGTSTQIGSFPFSISVRNASNTVSSTVAYTLTIVAAPAITITPTTLNAGTIGKPYSQVFTGADSNASDTFTWSIASGALPLGLSFVTSTATVTGTPTTVGTSTFSLKVVSKTNTSASTTQAFTLNIGFVPIFINPSTLSDGTVGTAYSQTFTASTTIATGTFTWNATGTIPDGLTVNTSTSPTSTSITITGTPTTAAASTFTISVKNGSSSVSQAYTLTIDAAPVPTPTPTPTPAPSGGGGGGGGGGGSYFPPPVASTSTGAVLGASTVNKAALFASLIQELVLLEKQLIMQTFKETGCPATFTKTLTQGTTDSQVQALQKVLNYTFVTQITKTGDGSPGYETTYFGGATKSAVITFQNIFAAEILTPNGLTSGNGFVGASTRAELNQLCSQ